MGDINVEYLSDDGITYRIAVSDVYAGILGYQSAASSLPLLPADISCRFLVARSDNDTLAIPAPAPLVAAANLGAKVTIGGVEYTFVMTRGESTLGLFSRPGSIAVGPPGPPGADGAPGSDGSSTPHGQFDPAAGDLRLPWGYRISSAGSTAFSAYGFPGATSQGAATSADDSDGAWINYLSPANDFAGVYYPNPFTRYESRPVIKARIKLCDPAHLKLFFFALGPWVTYIWNNLHVPNGCGIRFKPGTDTNLVFWTADSGDTPHEVDTGIPYVSGAVHTFCLDISDRANFQGWIDGQAFSSNSHLPDLHTGIFWGVGANPVDSGQTTNIKVGGLAGMA